MGESADQYRRYAQECVDRAKRLPTERRPELLARANRYLELALKAVSAELRQKIPTKSSPETIRLLPQDEQPPAYKRLALEYRLMAAAACSEGARLTFIESAQAMERLARSMEPLNQEASESGQGRTHSR